MSPMRNLIVVLIFASFVISSSAFGAEKKGAIGGVGVILGEPTGFVFKHWMDSRQAMDAGLAFSFNSFFQVYGDYLWHFPKTFASVRGAEELTDHLIPYVGLGGELFLSTQSARRDGKLFTDSGSSAGFGLRIPLGMEWRPSEPPLGVFVEFTPGVGIVPSTFGFFQGGIGVRYYF